METGRINVKATAIRECDTSGWVQSKICKYKRKQIITKHYITILLEGSNKDTTLQVIKNYVFLQPIVHKPLG